MTSPAPRPPADDDPTRLSRMRRWVENHRLLAPVLLLVGLLAGVGGAFGFGRDVYDLLRPDSSPPTPTTAVTAVPPEELVPEGNARYAFGFNRPQAWGRTGDPENSDGNAFEPLDGSGALVEAYGSLPFEESSRDPREALDAEVRLTEEFARQKGAEILESDYFGLYEVDDAGARAQIPGWRLVLAEPEGGSGTSPSTTVEVLTRWSGRNVCTSAAALLRPPSPRTGISVVRSPAASSSSRATRRRAYRGQGGIGNLRKPSGWVGSPRRGRVQRARSKAASGAITQTSAKREAAGRKAA